MGGAAVWNGTVTFAGDASTPNGPVLSEHQKAYLPDSLRRPLRAAYWAAQGIARRAANRRLLRKGHAHIHVLRETEHQSNGAFYDWLARRHPDATDLFRISAATDRSLRPAAGASLFLPWLADPVRERDPALFRKAAALEQAYAERGVPIVNPVAAVSISIKSRALPRMREAGVRAARTLLIDRATPFETIAEAVGTSFIVRNDRGHGGFMRLVHTPDDLREVAWDQLSHPLALEFIDTRGADDLYRKYRLLFAGSSSIPRHLIITPSWSAHAEDRMRGGSYLDEEMAFLQSPNPFHDDLDRVRRALGLDYVAFDYSVLPDGELVVWEPNPYPVLWGRANEVNPEYDYQRPHMDAVFDLVFRFYLDRAGIDHPALS